MVQELGVTLSDPDGMIHDGTTGEPLLHVPPVHPPFPQGTQLPPSITSFIGHVVQVGGFVAPFAQVGGVQTGGLDPPLLQFPFVHPPFPQGTQLPPSITSFTGHVVQVGGLVAPFAQAGGVHVGASPAPLLHI